MLYPKIIVLGDFALPQNALPQNNWPVNLALAGFKTWAESCGKWCGECCGDLVGMGWGLFGVWVGNISATPFKRILRPISARLGVGVRVGVGVAKKSPNKGAKRGFFRGLFLD
jgi:hypothetical protein